jgi:hypothetical protein
MVSSAYPHSAQLRTFAVSLCWISGNFKLINFFFFCLFLEVSMESSMEKVWKRTIIGGLILSHG